MIAINYIWMSNKMAETTSIWLGLWHCL